jgi:hypothetical protein
MKDALARFVMTDVDFAAMMEAECMKLSNARNQPEIRMTYSVTERGGVMTSRLPAAPSDARAFKTMSDGLIDIEDVSL